MSPILDSIGSVKSYGFGSLPLSSVNWALVTSGGSNDDYANDIAADSLGNLYYVGYFQSRGSIISVDKNGVFRWGKSLRIGNQTSTSLSHVRLGADGYIYASGGGSGGSNDAAILVKYDTSGNLQWSATRAGAYASFPKFNFDTSGNIYCVGQVTGSTTNGIAIVKYNSSGTHQGGVYNTTNLGNCSSNGITIDNNGDIYVAGRSDATDVGNGGTGNKSLFLKFNSSFTNQFFKSIDNGTTTGRYNAAYGCTQIGGTGNIYIGTIQSATNAGGIMSFNTSGTLQWARSMTAANAGGNTTDLVHDGTNVYITGYTASGNPMVWVKYDTSGTVLLSRKWSTNQNMYGLGIRLPGTTELAIGGYTYINATDSRQFATQVPRDGTKTGSSTVIGGQTYTYDTGTLTVASYSPSVANVSASWASIASPTTYSVNETTITPTVTKGSI